MDIHKKMKTVLLVNNHLMVKVLPPSTTGFYPVPELFEIHGILNSSLYLEWYQKLSFAIY